MRHIDVIELEDKVIDANRTLAAYRSRDPLSDRRVNLIINDARGALRLTTKKYDAVISQPSHPWTAGASHLYTREFMQLARDHLNPGGVFVRLEQIRKLTVTDLLRAARRYLVADARTVLFVRSSGEPSDEEVDDAEDAGDAEDVS